MKTALVLGGGGSRGSYQIGVWKALRELKISPDIITGTSVGALNGAMMVQNSFETAVTLWENLGTTTVFDFPKEPDFFAYTKAFFKQGGACRNGLKKLIQAHLQEDKIRTSPISFGMMLAKKEGLVPCPVFTEDIPKGMLSDYLMATTACFPAAKCHTISGVEYLDGGYCDNLPINLAKAKGAEKIIAVSLDTWSAKEKPFAKEPDIIPVYPRWNLGNWLIFHRENTERNIRLGYLDAMKAFGRYDGDAFTFYPHTFSEFARKNQVAICRWKQVLKSNGLFPDQFCTEAMLEKSADITGKFLKVSPYCVYTANSFLKAIRRKQHFPKNIATAEEKIADIFLSSFA